MPIRRKFIDWHRPGLEAAADYLIDTYASGSVLDLQKTIVALPGSQAGRRLLEIVVDRSAGQSLTLVPPTIITTGKLPELLYDAKLPFADPLTQRLAWIEAMKETERSVLTRLIRNPPEDDDFFAWLSLGEMLSALHRELAADGLDCTAVVEQGDRLATFSEVERWELLADIQRKYLRRLDELQLWDLQTARLFAIRHHECHTDADVVLVGAVDLNLAQRAMLDQVADQVPVTALVIAPRTLADRFDEHGCVLPQAWRDAPIDLDPNQIEIADGPGDQADAAARAVAGFDGRYAAEDIVIGVPDERVVSYVRQRLEECEIPVRYGVGTMVTHSEPCRLLQAVADFLESRRFQRFANLVRHPALEYWLMEKGPRGDWLTELDDYHGDHFPWQVSHRWLVEKKLKSLPRVFKIVDRLLREFSGDARPLGEWSQAVVDLLVEVYGSSDLDSRDTADRLVLSACERIQGVLRDHLQICPSLAPRVTGAEALRLTLRALEGVPIPPPADISAVELLGWLELPLHDAPALIVTGLNEGIVPSARNGDMFLPNELRRHLKLEDNERRYARDAYALSVLAAGKQELKIIVGRRTADNDPLVPSRLLFACDGEQVACRTLAMFASPASESQRIVLPGRLKAGRERAEFEPPRPFPLPDPVNRMRVTEFRDYLACPYRYYLRHRLKLRSRNDAAEELDAARFGTLLHDVLTEFGRKCIDDERFAEASVRAAEIEDFLNAMLEQLVAERYGKEPLPAVSVQVELLRLRLGAFAAWQAGWARRGWRIRDAERQFPEDEVSLDVDNEPMYLQGRIDRIDTHETTGECIIFDYKTGDSGRKPQQTHRSGDSWIDLQLPLYRHAGRWLEVSDSTKVGYIVIPKDTDATGELLAEWAQEELDDAVQTARDIVRMVRNEEFWPPTMPPPPFFEEFAPICGDNRLGDAITVDEGEES